MQITIDPSSLRFSPTVDLLRGFGKLAFRPDARLGVGRVWSGATFVTETRLTRRLRITGRFLELLLLDNRISLSHTPAFRLNGRHTTFALLRVFITCHSSPTIFLAGEEVLSSLEEHFACESRVLAIELLEDSKGSIH